MQQKKRTTHTMKLIEKPIIKLSPTLTEMRERIEYIRCVTGHSIPSFSIKLGIRADRLRDIITDKKKPTITILDSIAAIFPMVNNTWLMAGVGSHGMTEKNIEPCIHGAEVKDTVDQALCARVKEVRETLGMTQVIFASHLKTTRDIINWVENGRGNPSVTLCQRIIEKFKVEDRWMIRGIGNMYNPMAKAHSSSRVSV